MSDYALRLSEPEVLRYRMMAAKARETESEQWALAGIAPGARVADVGCGPGAALVAMAEVVGPDGSVVGVDADPGAIKLANDMIAASGVANATARVGPADDTGLEPGGVDVAVMRHVLAHNGGREQAIVDHLASLVRPGGRVYLVDAELTAMRSVGLPPELQELSDRYLAYQSSRGNDMQIGLRLGQLLAGAGLELLAYRGEYAILPAPPGMRPPPWAARAAMVAAGFATEDEVAAWGTAFETLDACPDRPTLFLPGFTAVGRRPHHVG